MRFWRAKFRQERVKDETHPKRPQTAVLPETVATVEKMLRQDGWMTYSMRIFQSAMSQEEEELLLSEDELLNSDQAEGRKWTREISRLEFEDLQGKAKSVTDV